ncbi:MAG: amidohydrolase family protein [Acidobacteriota bacterium]
MKKLLTTACLFFVTAVATVSFIASPAPLLAQTRPTPQSQPLVFTHVTVIDVTARDSKRALKLDQTVIISGEHISALGKTGSVQIPDGTQVIDATGKFLIPGLWDMHVHIPRVSASALKLFLANGVTGVRDMGNNLERILDLRQQVASGSLLGPRMVVAGPAVDGPQGPNDKNPGAVRSAQQARAEVRRLKQAGVDFIKIYSYLSPEAFFAAMDEAKKRGLTAAGHVPWGVRSSDAAKAGLKSIEHSIGVMTESSDLEDTLREVSIREGKKGIRVSLIEVDQAERNRDSYNPAKLQRLNALFVKYHTWQCPTLYPLAAEEALFLFTRYGYPYLQYIPAKIQDAMKRPSTRFSPEQIPNVKVHFAHKEVLAAAMHRVGVQFLAGTDNGGLPFGFTLHDQLALFVQVGFSPMEALQTATINPARFFGKEKEMGTIERGKLADLVLLDANPLNNIDNTRRINAVIVNGRYLPKVALQTMLAEVEAAANKKSIAEMIFATIQEKGIAPALEQYRELNEKRSDTYKLDEDEMNDVGYRLLRMKKVNEAIEIFKLNVEAFPKSSNVYDSLGEAYMFNGDKDLAIKNYQKSVELNPQNTNGIEMLKKLQAK